MHYLIRHLAAVGLAVVMAAATIPSAPIVSASNSIPPSGCSRPGGEYDFGCRTSPGRPDGWFVSPAVTAQRSVVPANVK